MWSSRALVAALAAVFAAAGTAGCAPNVLSGSGHRAPCSAVFFGVAGSGQGPAFPAPTTVPRGVTRADARAYGPVIARVKDDLEAVAGVRLGLARAINYPATTAPHWASVGGLAGLAASEAIGARRLVASITRTYRRGCRARPVLVAGYSQGAEVVSLAVNRLSPREQRSVTLALLGNPSFEPGVRGDYPHGLTEAGVRPTFLGGSALRVSAAVRHRTIDICAPGDPVCGVAHPFGGMLAEVAYVLDHLDVHASAYGAADASRAAKFLWRHRVSMR